MLSDISREVSLQFSILSLTICRFCVRKPDVLLLLLSVSPSNGLEPIILYYIANLRETTAKWILTNSEPNWLKDLSEEDIKAIVNEGQWKTELTTENKQSKNLATSCLHAQVSWKWCFRNGTEIQQFILTHFHLLDSCQLTQILFWDNSIK